MQIKWTVSGNQYRRVVHVFLLKQMAVYGSDCGM